MRHILIAALIGFSGTAYAEECRYVSAFDLGNIQFTEDVAVARMSGAPPELCEVMFGDETGNELTCPSGISGNFSFAPAVYGGATDDLMVFMDHVWYRQCYEPT